MASVTIPTHCRAAVTRNPGANYTLETVEDYPVPTPGPTQLLLKINATGLCMSDHHFMLGDWGFVGSCECSGHEGAGVVVALGSAVDPEVWKVGDRAGLKPVFDTCQSCDLCRQGDEAHCAKSVLTGAFTNGSYAQYVVSPARYTTRIPEDVSDSIAAPIMCSGSTIYKGLKTSRARAGQWVVVPGGGGGVGHQALQYGKVMGLRVIAIDTGKEKEDMCMSMGAEAFIDFKTQDTVAEVLRLTGGGAHAVIVTGGTAGAYSTAPMFLRTGGVQVCIGMPPAGTAIAGADPMLIIGKKLTILGSLVGSMLDVDEALDFAARGLVKPAVTILPFKDFPEGMKMLTSGKVSGRLVIDFNA